MQEKYQEQAELLKALAHPVRLQIVRGLMTYGCRNVGCMATHTGQSQPCISQQLTRLRAAGIVTAERSGNEVYYSLADPRVEGILKILFPPKREEGT